MSALKEALEATGIVVRRYDTTKMRPVYTNTTCYSVGKFIDELVRALGTNLSKHPEIVQCLGNEVQMGKLLEEYAETELVDADGNQISVPQEIAHLTLNVDKSSYEPGYKPFFCTTPDELVDQNHSGQFYIQALKLSVPEAFGVARPVVPRYMPRHGPGIHQVFDPITNSMVPYFNTYVPAAWARWRKRNPKAWENLPAKPPASIMKLLKHVIPLKEERQYFYAWVYTSLTSRCFVYPILCGAPGLGKNRIKLLLRALHGDQNSADGKKETFGANQSKFNAQMADNTQIWFDELQVTKEMEPRMKEYQNPFISIEKKGVDATRSTEIHCSMVISNNNPRDNYLPFDSRKFAPLVMGSRPLKEIMSEDEIGEMSDRLGERPERMDVVYVAQIAKWILTVGPKYVPLFRNLEYSGPMFWELAHASMARWQKMVVMAMTGKDRRAQAGWDAKKGAFLWSKTEEALKRRKDFNIGNVHMATIRPFFESYRDRQGNPVFLVEKVLDGVIDDFWVKIINPGFKIDPRDKVEMEKIERPKLPTRPPKGMSQYQWRKEKERRQNRGRKRVENLHRRRLERRR